jgi:hypothetical protein
MPVTSDADALKALTAIETKLTAKGGGKAVELDGLCKQYMSLKPLLETALPLIERIPVYGQKIGSALRFLMRLADVVCPV